MPIINISLIKYQYKQIMAEEIWKFGICILECQINV